MRAGRLEGTPSGGTFGPLYPPFSPSFLSFLRHKCSSTAPEGASKEFSATARIDTPIEVDYYRHGGILHMVLRNLAG